MQIRTSHVGSLVRPPSVVRYVRARNDGVVVDPEAYDDMLQREIGEVVRRQAETGLDIVNDGEYPKRNFHEYALERLGGLQHRFENVPIRPHYRSPERRQFAEFYAEYEPDRSQARGAYFISEPIVYRGQHLLQRDIANLTAALAGTSCQGFMTAVAPASLEVNLVDDFYGDDEKRVFAIAEALRVEYRAIVEAGLIVQIDDPWITGMLELVSEPEYERWVDLRIAALNHALEGLPEAQTRYHLCWGSWNGPHVADVPLRRIVHHVLRINVGGYSIEAANPRHEHEWRVWEDVRLPDGKELLPGLVSRLHQRRRTSGVGRRTVGADCPPGRTGAGDREHRLRVLADRDQRTRPRADHVGQTGFAGRGCALGQPRARGNGRRLRDTVLLNATDLQILVRLHEGMTQGQIGSELGMEQSAVSRTLRSAELRLGLPLLQADGRRTRLTSVGRELARAGAFALRQLQAVDGAVASLRAGRANHLRIVASTTPGTYLLPQVVARFLLRNPDAQVDVEVVRMTTLWDAFVGGGYDLAIAPRMPFSGDVSAQAVYIDSVVFFTAPQHPLAGRGVIGFEELHDETVVGKFNEAYWGQLHYELWQRGYTWAREVDLRSAEAVKQIVAGGLGVGMLFASALQRELGDGTLRALAIPTADFAQTYFLVRPQFATNPLAQHFGDFLRGQWSPAAPP